MNTRGWLLLMLLGAPCMANEPTRLLSAGSSITELVVALDAEPQLVAVDSTSELPAGSELPRLGYHRQLSAEGILSTSPSLVIGSDQMGPATALKLVRQAGVQVETLPEAMGTEQLGLNILRLGELLDRTAQAKALHDTVQQRANALSEQPIAASKRTLFLF